jgi:hypothetical protein
MNTSEQLDAVIERLREVVEYLGTQAADAAREARDVDLIERPQRQGMFYERSLALAEANGSIMPIVEMLTNLRDQPTVEYAYQPLPQLDEIMRTETTVRRVKVGVAPGRVVSVDIAINHTGSVLDVDAQAHSDDHLAAIRSAFDDARWVDVERAGGGAKAAESDALTGAISGVGAQLAQQLNRINTAPPARPPLTAEQRAQIQATTPYVMPLPEMPVRPAWETQPESAGGPDATPQGLAAERGPMPFVPEEDQYVSGVQVVGGARVWGLYQGTSGDGVRLVLPDDERSTLVWADTLEAYRPLPGDSQVVMGRYYDSSAPDFAQSVMGTLTHYERQREPDIEWANIRNTQGDFLVPLHTLWPAAVVVEDSE